MATQPLRMPIFGICDPPFIHRIETFVNPSIIISNLLQGKDQLAFSTITSTLWEPLKAMILYLRTKG